MKAGREQKEERTSEDRERMARGTERDKVGCDGKERDATRQLRGEVRRRREDRVTRYTPHVRAAK